MGNQKLGEFINSLAIKAGLAVDNDKLKMLLSDPSFATIEVDAVIVDSINKGLMTEDFAINNPTILNKARAEAYNRVDDTFNRDIVDLLDDTDKEAIKGKKLTIEKVSYLKDVIQKLKEAKKEPNADKAVYQKQIDDLQALVKAEKENGITAVNTLKQAHENESIENSLKLLLNGRNYRLSMETEQDKQFAVDTALLKVKQDLNNKGYKVIRENGQNKLVTSENLKVFDQSNNELGLTNFIDGAIAQLIAPTTNGGNGGNPPPPPPSGGGANKPSTPESAKSAMSELLASFG